MSRNRCCHILYPTNDTKRKVKKKKRTPEDNKGQNCGKYKKRTIEIVVIQGRFNYVIRNKWHV